MTWRVTLTGADTGTGYVFEIDAPADAFEPMVYASAFHEYRNLVEIGDIADPYCLPTGIEYIDDKES